MRLPNSSKPFVWVSVPKEPPKRQSPVTHERFVELTGALEFDLTVESDYLSVGSGTYEFNTRAEENKPDVWHTFYRRNGQLCVPASSIKGAIRSIVEAISNSCISHHRQKKERVDHSHKPCRYKKEKDKLCPACRIFGVSGLRGRAYFEDAIADDSVKTEIIKIGELWKPKKYKGRKFYEIRRFVRLNLHPERNFRFVEAVPKGSKFRGRLRFENLTRAELGLLCLAMGLSPLTHEQFTPKIGSGKARCLGAIKFELIKMHLCEGRNFKNLLQPRFVSGSELSTHISQWISDCRKHKLLHDNSWKIFTKSMQNKEEICPQEVY